jgi:hypothetical protein
MEPEPCEWYLLELRGEFGVQYRGQDTESIRALRRSGSPQFILMSLMPV